MNVLESAPPWALGFSYARALQATAMRTWRGQPQNIPAAQDALAHRARCNGAAREGRYTAELEQAARELVRADRA
jgi:fructose-bisphosphate aldolase class I